MTFHVCGYSLVTPRTCSATEFSHPPLQYSRQAPFACPGRARKRHALYPHLYSAYIFQKSLATERPVRTFCTRQARAIAGFDDSSTVASMVSFCSTFDNKVALTWQLQLFCTWWIELVRHLKNSKNHEAATRVFSWKDTIASKCKGGGLGCAHTDRSSTPTHTT